MRALHALPGVTPLLLRRLAAANFVHGKLGLGKLLGHTINDLFDPRSYHRESDSRIVVAKKKRLRFIGNAIPA